MLLNKTDKTDYLLLLLFAFSAMAVQGTFLQVALHIVLPIVFVIIGIQNIHGLLPNKSLKYYLALVLWLGISCLTAFDSEVAFHEMIKIVSAFLCSFAAYHLAIKKQNIIWVYIIMILSFASMMYYASNNIGFSIAYEAQDRLQDEVQSRRPADLQVRGPDARDFSVFRSIRLIDAAVHGADLPFTE